MTQFNIHGCTHYQRKALVTEAIQQQAPPNKDANKLNEYKDKALPSTVDGKDRLEGIPNPWFTGPPNNIIQFNNDNYNWREEIRELKKQIEAAKFNTAERQHYFSLLNELALNRKIPEEVQAEAIDAVIKYAREEFEEMKSK